MVDPGFCERGSVARYPYRPLKGSDIRVATLHPGSVADQLSISLRHVGPAGEPKYEALSYTWGDPENICSLRCDGAQLNVTKNLYRALIRLRDERNPLTLWIDAVCIDQADLQERSEQVSLMKYIYAGATKVIVWLGEDDATTSVNSGSTAGRAVALLKSWASKSELEFLNTAIAVDFLADTDEARVNAACIQSILRRPWWSRVWVLQELCMAQEAELVCGKYHLPWTTFDEACYALGRFVHLERVVDTEYSSSMRILYSQFRTTKSNRAATSRKAKLSQLLVQTQSRKATDPRDKIYALLGLAWYDASEPFPYPVDYSLPTETVYTQYTKAAIKKDGDLAILSHVRVPESKSYSLPSWVPDWRQDPTTRPLSPYAPGSGPHYSATPHQLLNMLPDNEGKLTELGLQGLDIDVIRSVISVRPFVKVCAENLEHLDWRDFFPGLRRFQVALVLDDEYMPTCEPSTVALIRTLMADESPISERLEDKKKVLRFPHHFCWFHCDPNTGEKVPRGLGEIVFGTPEQRSLYHRQLLDAEKLIRQLYHRMFHLDDINSAGEGELLRSSTTTQKFAGSDFVAEQSYYETDEVRSEIAREIADQAAWRGGRVLFVTHQGFLGLGPPSTMVGDNACLLFGGDVPYILRSEARAAANTWTFIGEAYIHGWMDGELMSQKGGSRKVEEFVLV